MILSFGPSPDPDLLERARRTLIEGGLIFETVICAQSTLLVITSPGDDLAGHDFSALPGVQKLVSLGSRAALALEGGRALIEVLANDGSISIGGRKEPVVIAGPSLVESLEQLSAVAAQVKASGAKALWAGAYKQGPSPYDFQGLGLEGLKLLKEVGLANKLPVVSEVMTRAQVEQASLYVDVFLVGAGNMYNYELLKELGRQPKPVVLKRAMSATIDEFLQAAEYILLGGNLQVILCERGIRTFETSTLSTLDLSAVAVLKNVSNLPVIVDPSHATGKRELIRPLSRAAIACGADGLMIQADIEPDKSYADAGQAIGPELLGQIVEDVAAIYRTLKLRDSTDPASSPVSTPASADLASDCIDADAIKSLGEREQNLSGYRQS
jgi:3-deoxy-7-phosphoheptulonate synthase